MGTIILVCAVAELAQLGPNEPADMDVLELLREPEAIIWVIFMIVCSLLGIAASYATLNLPMDSFLKLCSLACVVSFTTVIGSSISKCFGLLSGFELYVSFFLYFVDGVTLMLFTVLANAKCDVSIFVPAQLSSQLVINMITGYLVWGDAKYVEKPVPYI